MQIVAQRRGVRLHTLLLFEEVNIPTHNEELRSGRNPHLIESRDNCLLHRFYFKTKIQRKIYEDVLKELEHEFFLSKMMIQKILQNKADDALLIKRQQPSLKDLKDQFPFMVW